MAFMKIRLGIVFFLVVCMTGGGLCDPYVFNERLGRGLNLGNWLEAPSEGAWGVRLDESDFENIAQQGFNSVRIPVRWSGVGRAAIDSPYTISPDFFARVDFAIDNALQNGLHAVVNCHHYDELFADLEAHRDRFLGFWRQIGRRYRDYPDSLGFEILNEPHDQLTAKKWNELLASALEIIREENPDRTVIIGVAEWGGVDGVRKLVIPEDDNLILTIHYYLPFHFTHQGASWVEGSDAWLGTTWEGDYLEKLAVVNDFAFVRSYAQQRDLPIYIGEFGAYSMADIDSRARWTAYCARLFESYDFSWAYWEYSSGFGAWDPSGKQWREPLVEALQSNDETILALNPGELGPNLLKNGEFSLGEQHWLFGAWNGEARAAVIDSEYVFEITDPGENLWDIQLIQGGLHLSGGRRYGLLFDARADSVRTINAGLENASDYSSYGALWNQVITAEWGTYGLTCQVPADDANARVSFSFGGATPGVAIDNVRLYDLSQPASIRPMRRGPSAGVASSVSLTIRARTLRFEVYASAGCSAEVACYDLAGKNLWRTSFPIAPGAFQKRIRIGRKLPAAEYLFVVRINGRTTLARKALVP